MIDIDNKDYWDGLVTALLTKRFSFAYFYEKNSNLSLGEIEQLIIEFGSKCKGNSDAFNLVLGELKSVFQDQYITTVFENATLATLPTKANKEAFAFTEAAKKIETTQPSLTLEKLDEIAAKKISEQMKRTPGDEGAVKEINNSLRQIRESLIYLRRAIDIKKRIEAHENNVKLKATLIKEYNDGVTKTVIDLKTNTLELQSDINPWLTAYEDHFAALYKTIKTHYDSLVGLDGSCSGFQADFKNSYQDKLFNDDACDALRKREGKVVETLKELDTSIKNYSQELDSLKKLNDAVEFVNNLPAHLNKCRDKTAVSFPFENKIDSLLLRQLDDEFYPEKYKTVEEFKTHILAKKAILEKGVDAKEFPTLSQHISAYLTTQLSKADELKIQIEENQKNDRNLILCHLVVESILNLKNWQSGWLNFTGTYVQQEGKRFRIPSDISNLIEKIKKTKADWIKNPVSAKQLLNELKDYVNDPNRDISHLKANSKESALYSMLGKLKTNGETDAIGEIKKNDFISESCAFVSPQMLTRISLPKNQGKESFSEKHPKLQQAWTSVKKFFAHPTTKTILKGAAIGAGIVLFIAAAAAIVYFAAPALPFLIPVIPYLAESILPVVVASAISKLVASTGTAAATAIVLGATTTIGATIGASVTAAGIGIKNLASKAWTSLKNRFGFGGKEYPAPEIATHVTDTVKEPELQKSEPKPIPTPKIVPIRGPLDETLPIAVPIKSSTSITEIPTSPCTTPCITPVITPSSSPHAVFGFARENTKNSQETVLLKKFTNEVVSKYLDYQKSKPNAEARKKCPPVKTILKRGGADKEFLLKVIQELLSQSNFQPLRENKEFKDLFADIDIPKSERIIPMAIGSYS